MIISFITALVIVVIYTILFVLLGRHVLIQVKKSSDHAFFLIGFSFFVGCALFLLSWLTISHLIGSAKIALFICTALGIVLSFITLNNTKKYLSITKKQCTGVLIFFIFVISFGTFRALTPIPTYFASAPEYVNPFLGFGSVGHSFRAGNIAEYIVANDTIPLLNQHSGQSILAAIPIFIADSSAQLTLTLWLNIFLGFLCLSIYSVVRMMTKGRSAALISLFVLFFGNTVLSPVYTSITDTESAVFLTTNIDTTFGIASFLLLLLLLYRLAKGTISKAWFLFFTLLFGLVWSITSGQMLLLYILSLAVAAVLFRGEPGFFRKTILPGLATLLISGLLGAYLLGGMLSPHTANISVPGIMSLHQPDTPALLLRFPRTGEGYSSWQPLTKFFSDFPDENQEPLPDLNAPKTDVVATEVKENTIVYSIARLVRSVQLVFFPLLGLTISYVLIRRRIFLDKTTEFTSYLWWQGTVLFFVGWICSSVFTLYGYYWELSKFFIIGSVLSMLLLALSLARLLPVTNQKKLVVACIIFITIGPVSDYFFIRPLGNLILSADTTGAPLVISEYPPNLETLTLSERFNLLLSARGMYGEKI